MAHFDLKTWRAWTDGHPCRDGRDKVFHRPRLDKVWVWDKGLFLAEGLGLGI